MLDKLVQYFREEIVILSCPSYASLVAFRSHALHQLKLVEDDEGDSNKHNIKQIAKEVKRECKDIQLPNDYTLDINTSTAAEASSDTLLTMMAALSPDLDHMLPAILIGNMVTAIVKKKTTALQIALGVLFKDSKSLLTCMHDF